MAHTAINLYPHLTVKVNQHPNRFYAFPLLGIIVKIIMLIPVFIEAFFLGIAFLFFLIANPFVVLFTAKYWDAAFDFFLGMMRFYTKIYLFMLGLSDEYPGFNLKENSRFELTITKPTTPNRWLAFPLFGFVIRVILLIPYQIYSQVLRNGSFIAMVISWFTVLFTDKIPESLYEFEKDSLRVALANTSYIIGLSDKYPSFTISMNHQTVKILLIIAGAICFATNAAADMKEKPGQRMHRDDYQYEYNSQDHNGNDNYYKKTY
jgi:hypothetical protein